MRYQAFIEHSHVGDRRAALALQRALVSFAKPRFSRPNVAVFRDETGLTIAPALWPAIQAAIDDSEHFVLLASPSAATSPWVQREVQYWLDHRGPDSILLVLTGGELYWDADASDFDWGQTTALPDLLRGVFANEPLWVDLRWATNEKNLASARVFQEPVATILSALMHRRKEELLADELAERRHDLLSKLGSAAIEKMSRRIVPSARGTTEMAIDYDVALSFAAEQRSYVEQVVVALRARGVQAFYDYFEIWHFWGKDLRVHLWDVYENRSKYVVIFASAEYAASDWSRLELSAAQARAVRENREYILLARFDDTQIPGVAGAAYIDLRHTQPIELAEMIIKKID